MCTDDFKLYLDGMYCNLKILICYLSLCDLYEVDVRYDNVCIDNVEVVSYFFCYFWELEF